jgi:hypothetical protein
VITDMRSNSMLWTMADTSVPSCDKRSLVFVTYTCFHKLPTALQHTNEWTANGLKAIRAASQPVHPHSHPFTPDSRSTRSLVCHSDSLR